jgi:hypothetical protein
MTMKACLLLLFAAASLPCRADVANDIQKQLSPFEVLRGRFDQQKSIRIIRRPLKSAGTFVLLKGKGLLWNTETPIGGTLKITRDEIVQIKNGKAAYELKASSQPALKLVGDLLFAVFSADLNELRRHFEISGSMENGHWKAALRPKEAWMARVAKSITLEGGTALEALGIDEANGDRTQIRFSGVDLNSRLSPSEKALFD